MAGIGKTRGFVCSCFFTSNIFIKKYNLHVSFFDKQQFMEDYSKALRQRGCVTEKQFDDTLREIENEVARRRQLGATSLLRQREIRKNYVPLQKAVYHLQESYLDPRFLSLVAAAKRDSATADCILQEVVTMGEEIYTFPIFTEEFCKLLLEELENIEQNDCPKGRPNTMNQYGVLLNEYNFNEGLLDPLRLQYLHPIAAVLYPSWGGHSLDSHKAFTVNYEIDRDVSLSTHFDNAEVTLNVALGHDGFTGGELYFYNMHSAVDMPHKETPLRCPHHVGWGVLHRGLHKHGAMPVTAGKRCNLIMWMRSSSIRNARCPMCWDEPHLQEVPGLDDGFRPEAKVVDMCRAL